MRSAAGKIGAVEAVARLAKLARRLKTASRFGGLPLPALWMLTDEARGDPVAAARRLPPGSGIVLRHYRDPGRGALARQLATVARERSLTLLVGADARLAETVKAHGVHLPRWAVRRAGPRVRGLITASAHSIFELEAARRWGAAAVFAGPVFVTASHESAQPLGAVRFSALTHHLDLPVFALGGINEENCVRLLGSGAAGIGAIGALLQPTEQEAKS